MFGEGWSDLIFRLTKQLGAKPVDTLSNFVDDYLFSWTVEYIFSVGGLKEITVRLLRLRVLLRRRRSRRDSMERRESFSLAPRRRLSSDVAHMQ